MKIPLDTPLTRLKKEFEAKIAEKEEEIAELKKEKATIHGVNELLKLELAALDNSIQRIVKTLSEVTEHVRILKLNLPDMKKDDNKD